MMHLVIILVRHCEIAGPYKDLEAGVLHLSSEAV